MKDNDIDKLLRDWNAGLALDNSRDDEVKKRIMDRLDDKLADIEVKVDDPYFHIPKKLFYAAGLAAVLCLAFLLGTRFGGGNGRNGDNTVAPATLASLSQDDIKALKRLASEVDTLFPEGVRVLSQSDDGNIDIDTTPRLGIGKSDKLLIRYVVLKKLPGAGWTRVRVADIIAPGGEPVSLRGKDSGHLWTLRTDKNIYAVESNLAFNIDGKTITLNYSGIQSTRVPKNVKSVKTPYAEYKIYQTLDRI